MKSIQRIARAFCKAVQAKQEKRAERLLKRYRKRLEQFAKAQEG